MKVRKSLVGMAAAVLAVGSVAQASDTASVADNAQSDVAGAGILPAATPLAMDDAAPAPRKPLMALLDKVGAAKPLDDLNINIYGFVEGGYFYDFSAPRNSEGPDYAAFPGFNSKNRLMLDQTDLTIERTVDASKGKFDVGFRIEGIYGTDARFIHSSGILDNNLESPRTQFDLNQAYLTLAIPVGTGLTVTAGKFNTLLGYEVINPTGNQLFTHSYSFAYAIPFTQTGVLAQYNLTDKLSVTAGFTRGWNQTTRDNNGAIDFLGQLSYKATDKLSLIANVSEGPEATKDDGDYWTVVEGIAQYKMSDNLTLAVDGVYGDAPHALGRESAQWYGAAAYAGLKLNSMFTVNVRGEWYRDNNGFTTNAVAANYYEVTGGVAITPLPNDPIFQYLSIRPEVRYDLSDRRVFDSGDYTQFSGAVDAIMQF